jgi:hypothetical protein
MRNDGLDKALVDRIKKELSAKSYQKADVSLDAITPEGAEKQGNYQNAMTAAILIDKARLIDGQATQLVAHHHTAVLREIEGAVPDSAIDVTPEPVND